jgi:PAS domain S-box-containing protein
MFRFKSPGLLIRISHLILVQIIFIFVALALVLFDTGDKNSVTEYYSRTGQNIHSSSLPLFSLLRDSAGLPRIDSSTIAEVNNHVNKNSIISDVDVFLYNTVYGHDSLIHLADKNGDNMHKFSLPVISYGSSSPDTDTFRKPYWAALSSDGKYLAYFIRSENINDKFGLVVICPNTLSGTLQNSQAKWLFLLFLFAALISLLIINLIFRGIRRPLGRLVEAFEKTARGQEYYITEEAEDKEISRLTKAYNKMSQILAEKQRKLSVANRELVKSNKSLVESESILTALVDYSPDPIVVTDLDDQVIIYNQQAARDFGYNQNDMLGKRISNIFSVPGSSRPHTKSDSENEEAQEIICRRRDGGRFPALLRHTALGPEGSQPIAMLYFIKNISESRNYQNMILKLDRIASRGKMARDIAHEINNYLAVLQGNLELLPMILAKNDMPKFEQKLNVMKDTVTKISNFTDGLTQFSDENSEFRKEDLNQLVENLVAFVRPQNKFDDILIGTNLSENLPLVEIDAGQIQLLLVNLLYNSAESLVDFDGTRWIIISTALDESSQHVQLKVADSGPGIASEYFDRLFIYRFTTKRKSNGQGLITCKSVVDNHKGEISYHTGDESKAIFMVKIPVKRIIDKSTAVTSDAGYGLPEAPTK